MGEAVVLAKFFCKPVLFSSVLILVLFSAGAYQKHSLSIHFVDENDNFVAAKLITRGHRLYRQIFSHHQPIPYLISASIQKFFPVNNLLLLVQRHRYFLIFWSSLWILLLVTKFSFAGLGLATNYELIKYFYLGNLFLAESLIAYPLTYLILFLFSSKKSNFDIFFAGLVSSFLAFSLATLWPLIAIIFLFLFFARPLQKRYLLLGFLLPTLIIFLYTDLSSYWRNVIVVNRQFYIPSIKPEALNILTSYLSANHFIKLIFLSYAFVFLSMLRHRQYLKAIFCLIIVFSANIRNSRLDGLLYQGFHLIPLIIVILAIIWSSKNKVLFPIMLLLISIPLYSIFPLKSKSPENEFYIDFSSHQFLREAIKILGKPGDQILMLSNETLVLWQELVKPATSWIFYYPWMNTVPSFQKELNTIINDNMPKFICLQPEYQEYFTWVKQFYSPLFIQNQPSQIYLRNDQFTHITTSETSQLNFFRFTLPPNHPY